VKITQNDQAAATVAPQAIGGQRPSSTQQPAAPGRTPSSAFPGSLSDLVVSFENVKQKGEFGSVELALFNDLADWITQLFV
jgi:CCR4-NOT transcription complex subunit 3